MDRRTESLPDEPLPPIGTLGFRVQGYGMLQWGDLFTSRQALALTTLIHHIQTVGKRQAARGEKELDLPVQTVLSLALDKQADSNSSLCAWRSTSQDIGHTFGRQALPQTWDFVEGNIFSGATRDWLNAIEGTYKSLTSLDTKILSGKVERCSGR